MRTVKGLLVLAIMCCVCSCTWAEVKEEKEITAVETKEIVNLEEKNYTEQVAEKKHETEKVNTEKIKTLSSGTVVPQDVLASIVKLKNDIRILNLQSAIVKESIVKNETAIRAEFYIWLVSEGIERKDLNRWDLTNNGKAIMKPK